MKKIAFLLSILMLIPLFCIAVPAESEPATEFKFGINAINKSLSEGQSMILTPAYGETITAKGGVFDWCRVAVFDWSVEEKAYVLISVDTQIGTGMQKTAVIPPNGFALVANTGNNWPALGYPDKPNYVNETSTFVYENIGQLKIGAKAYLTGIDLMGALFEYEGEMSKYYSADDFTTKAFVTISDKKIDNSYEPDTTNIMDAPSFIYQADDVSRLYPVTDIKLSWEAVDGATEYHVNVCDSTINANGTNILSEITDKTEATVLKDKLTVGAKYTAYLYSTDGVKYSPVSTHEFVVVSDRAMENKFNGKKIVAFGDSITAWTGWVSMLYGEIGVDVINAGVGGDTTADALARIDKDVIAENPDLTIINFGMNDQALFTATGKNNTPIDKYEENYRKIIEKIQATGSKIILVAVHDVCVEKYGKTEPAYDQKDADGVTYVDRYNEIVKKLAIEYNLGFLDINSKAQDMLVEMSLDGVHLNEVGQKRYTEWISDYLFQYVDENTDWGKEEASAPNGSDSNDNTTENDIDVLTIAIIVAGVIILAVAVVIFVRKKK